MVSKLYKADNFYKMQQSGKIAKVYNKSEKLNKDPKGFYLNRKSSNGDVYKQRVKSNDMVYTRAERGVTKYSQSIDKDIKAQTIQKSTKKDHEQFAHVSDREAKTSKRRYRD